MSKEYYIQLYAINVTKKEYKPFQFNVDDKSYINTILANTKWDYNDNIQLQDLDSMMYLLTQKSIGFKKIE